MNVDRETAPISTPKQARLAVLLTIAGLTCVVLFLVRGFAAWSVGVGIFLGIPLLLLGLIVYVNAVIGDLRKRGALDDDN